MGMGEPMMNLDNVLAACERLPDVGITHRHTTVSTVGWIPGIERLTERDMPIRLALSLHAPDEALRSRDHAGQRPLPARRRARGVPRLLRARKRRTVFIEYVMLDGVNDRYEQARRSSRSCCDPRTSSRST